MATDPDGCRRAARDMDDRDLLDAITVLGPDSPLLPAVRAEILHRLESRTHDTQETR
jgi:hypothetical protein